VILVVLFHANGLMNDPNYFGVPVTFISRWNYGYMGVDLFFVISGFIIYHVHHTDIGRPAGLRQYLLKRFVRVFPVYWVAFLLLTGAYAIKGEVLGESGLHLAEIVTDFFLVPSARERNFLEVGWTLFFELVFYVCFATLIFNKSLGRVVLGIYFAAAFAVVVSGHRFSTPFNLVLSYYPLEFLLGMLVATVTPEIKSHGKLLLIAGILLLVAGCIVNGQNPTEFRHPFNLVFGMASALLISGALILERDGPVIVDKQQKFPRKIVAIFIFIGTASYSIYLTHTPLLWVSGRIATMLYTRFPLPTDVVFFLLVSGAVMGGCIFYQYVEKPLLRLLRNWLVSKRPHQKPTLSATSNVLDHPEAPQPPTAAA
jgi:exopolysaccharide production protein ExoZ